MYQLFVDAHGFECAVENLVEGILRNLLNGCLDVAFIVSKNGADLPENHLVLVFAQGYDATIVDGVLTVGNDLV